MAICFKCCKYLLAPSQIDFSSSESPKTESNLEIQGKFQSRLQQEGVTYCGRAGFIFCPINGAVAGERGGRTANKSETDPDLSMALVRAQLATLLEDKGRMGAKC